MYTSMVQTWNMKDGELKSGVSMSTGAKELPEALTNIVKGATYYLALGYKVRIGDVINYCDVCGGSGRIRKGKRIMRYVSCKACHGEGHFGIEVPGFDLKQSENITITMK